MNKKLTTKIVSEKELEDMNFGYCFYLSKGNLIDEDSFKSFFGFNPSFKQVDHLEKLAENLSEDESLFIGFAK